MNLKEALLALADGKKIRGNYWDTGNFIHLDSDGKLNSNQGTPNAHKWLESSSTYNWEIFEEPVAKRKVTLWRKPWTSSDELWFQSHWAESKAVFEKNKIKHWNYHGEWESVEVEIES